MSDMDCRSLVTCSDLAPTSVLVVDLLELVNGDRGHLRSSGSQGGGGRDGGRRGLAPRGVAVRLEGVVVDRAYAAGPAILRLRVLQPPVVEVQDALDGGVPRLEVDEQVDH